MGPRSAGFDELESGYSAPEHEEAHEPEYAEEDEAETSPATAGADAEEDELAIAEQEYLREIHSGMLVSEEDQSI